MFGRLLYLLRFALADNPLSAGEGCCPGLLEVSHILSDLGPAVLKGGCPKPNSEACTVVLAMGVAPRGFTLTGSFAEVCDEGMIVEGLSKCLSVVLVLAPLKVTTSTLPVLVRAFLRLDRFLLGFALTHS